MAIPEQSYEPDWENLRTEAKAALAGRSPAAPVIGGLGLSFFLFAAINPLAAIGGLALTTATAVKWGKDHYKKWDELKDGKFLDLIPYEEQKNLELRYGKDAIQDAVKKGDYSKVQQILSTVNVTHTQVNASINTTINNYNAPAAPTTPVQQPKPESIVDVNPIPVQPVVTPTRLQQTTVLQEPEPIAPPVDRAIAQIQDARQAFYAQTKPEPAYTPDVDPTEFDWVEDFKYAPFVLIYGAQGAGKSTVAEWLCYERLSMGHQVDICDPHMRFGQWKGLTVLGAGMRYLDIDGYLKSTIEKITARYQRMSTEPSCNFKPVTILLEEMTSWELEVPAAPEFMKKTLSDFRKVLYHVIQVAHDDTMTATGGAKGVCKARNSTMMKLQLFSEPVPGTTKLRSTGEGVLTYPDGRVKKVKIPPYFQNPKIPDSPVADMVQSAIAQTIAAESQTTEELINRQSEANFHRIHAESAVSRSETEIPELPAPLVEMKERALLLAQQRATYNKEKRATLAKLELKEEHYEALHFLLTFLECSKTVFCVSICNKNASGGGRAKCVKFYAWLEEQYGTIYTPPLNGSKPSNQGVVA